MSESICFTIDGREVQAEPGWNILEAAERAGIFIPHLCAMEGLLPAGRCRLCTVLVDGRPQAACTTPVREGIQVVSASPELEDYRRIILELIFVEGNHFCPSCEKSGNCELQALAYRYGITAVRFPYRFPRREVDLSHPDAWLDRNRCVRCGRCGRASRQLDGKAVFGMVGRGPETELAVEGGSLARSSLEAGDRALEACPVGALLPKGRAFTVPIGERRFDRAPIGAETEASDEEVRG